MWRNVRQGEKKKVVNIMNVYVLLKANIMFIYCSYKPKQQVGSLSMLILFLIGESFTDED